MKLLDQTRCVVVPAGALDAWAKATPEARAAWVGSADFGVFDVGGSVALFLNRVGSALHPVIAVQPQSYLVVVVSAETDEDIRFAYDEPEEVVTLAEAAGLGGSQVLFHIDTPVVAASDGAPARVDGEHYAFDVAPGTYQIEGRTSGPGIVITLQRIGD